MRGSGDTACQINTLPSSTCTSARLQREGGFEDVYQVYLGCDEDDRYQCSGRATDEAIMELPISENRWMADSINPDFNEDLKSNHFTDYVSKLDEIKTYLLRIKLESVANQGFTDLQDAQVSQEYIDYPGNIYSL